MAAPVLVPAVLNVAVYERRGDDWRLILRWTAGCPDPVAAWRVAWWCWRCSRSLLSAGAGGCDAAAAIAPCVPLEVSVSGAKPKRGDGCRWSSA